MVKKYIVAYSYMQDWLKTDVVIISVDLDNLEHEVIIPYDDDQLTSDEISYKLNKWNAENGLSRKIERVLSEKPLEDIKEI